MGDEAWRNWQQAQCVAELAYHSTIAQAHESLIASLEKLSEHERDVCCGDALNHQRSGALEPSYFAC